MIRNIACKYTEVDMEDIMVCSESGSGRESDNEEGITVMIRNIACKYTEVDMEDIMERAGLGGKYSKLYVPRSTTRARPANLGYAFVTLPSLKAVEECRTALEGKSIGRSASAKKCEVVMAYRQKVDLGVSNSSGA